MAKSNIFSDFLLHTEIKDDEIKNKILSILEKEEKQKNNNFVSNRGGFQSNTIDDKLIQNFFLHQSVSLIQENFKFKNLTEVKLVNIWINKNFKGDYNVPHVHPLCHFSGIYYLKTSNKDGKLIFLKGDNSSSMMNNLAFIDHENFYHRFEVQPKNNLFILFPSNLKHMVEPHYEEHPRISVSFNLVLGNAKKKI